MRADLSNWIVHFVHRRNPENLQYDDDGEIVYHPLRYIAGKSAIYSSFWNHYDKYYAIEGDAYAFSVMLKILHDGYIHAGWAIRNEKPTIYGPRAAVCFTEMPLYALIDYARTRAHDESVTTYGIAVLRTELFRIGGRPVIYGLTGDHQEAAPSDPYFIAGCRMLSSKCDIGSSEQYRYVATNLAGPRKIDWTHEREWRWTKDFTGESDDTPGLSLWLSDKNMRFSSIVVLVSTDEEANQFLDEMKIYYDSGVNDEGFEFSRKALLSTKVLSLEQVNRAFPDDATISLEKLGFRSLSSFAIPNPSKETVERVRNAIDHAKAIAAKAIEGVRGSDHAAFGFVNVMTTDSQTEVTQALIELGYADSIGGRGYFVREVMSGIDGNLMMDVEEIAADAAAKYLTEELGQYFFVHTRLD